MKRILLLSYIFGGILPILLISSCGNKKINNTSTDNTNQTTMTKNFHDFSIASLTGGSTLNMADFKGKKILVVNVASKCGYTSQYAGLEKLYKDNKDKLVVIGFPCNQFMGQEPGTAEEIQQFCSSTYGVSFPMTEKIDVKGGNQHPIYHWLTSKEFNGKGDFKISWNFNKFLLDENGKLISHFGSGTEPLSDEITSLL